ncbi:hypothetical protein [Candidatus Methanoperedens nitratireducens]|uniref:Uncharacterized protein n=1 Tax=Candidatus Methanoperedens nitratireducens TaxID=1392998 RepID=A0A284VKW0_9EURY|nr:hypothetical protein [Candidatus Methanoperedens nitroreducens]SNQ59904.1 hypothetical protein MNV_1400004 [Candidatus Methanoperedens nitroreducens]
MVESRYIGFKTLNEVWNEYELEDGTIIKVKFILIKIIKENTAFTLNSQIVTGAIPPQDLIGTPSQGVFSPQELTQSIEKKDMQFKPTKEDWNVYELNDKSKLSVKPILVSISRTNKHDQHGEPIYAVQTQQIVKKI